MAFDGTEAGASMSVFLNAGKGGSPIIGQHPIAYDVVVDFETREVSPSPTLWTLKSKTIFTLRLPVFARKRPRRYAFGMASPGTPGRPQRRFGGPEQFLVIGLVSVAALSAVILSRPDFVAALNHWLEGAQGAAVRYGFLGVFLSMIVGNLTIAIVFPVTVVPFVVAAAGANPILVGLASGLGALIGEFSGYGLGRLGSKHVANRYPEAHAMLKEIAARRPRAIPVLLFLFSLLPLPDDVLFIPLGLIRYPWWKIALPAGLGKIIAGWFIAYGGAVSANLVADRTLSRLDLSLQLGFLASLIVFSFLLMRIPWVNVLRRARDGGRLPPSAPAA